MSDKMYPQSFEKLLIRLLDEYRKTGNLMAVPVKRPKYKNAIGPAAGPHTQLAGNIVAAFAAGASHFELKTVQIMEGEELGILKPCILSRNVVYNTEWSTELTVVAALNEYIKAYILLKILGKELGIAHNNDFEFIMSVGYDLEGIRSEKIDTFLNSMKNAKESNEWQADILYVLEHMELFENVTSEYVKSLSPMISDTISLSTMHGCKSEEIELIAAYLIQKKGLNTYIKLNPTLLGQTEIRLILNNFAYAEVEFDEKIFENDIDFESAVNLIKRLTRYAEKEGKVFGVKLTNTLPVKSNGNELEGDTMYMSGPALYPISISVAAKIAQAFNGDVKISYSGGADVNNIADILKTGIYPVTVSSILLKPEGYKNITKMNERIDFACGEAKAIDVNALETLSGMAKMQSEEPRKVGKTLLRKNAYSSLCARCKNCVDVCPNRANEKVILDGKSMVIHYDSLCNACGNCICFCIEGHVPYKEKWTVFEFEEAFHDSRNNGVLIGNAEFKYRLDGLVISQAPMELERLSAFLQNK